MKTPPFRLSLIFCLVFSQTFAPAVFAAPGAVEPAIHEWSNPNFIPGMPEFVTPLIPHPKPKKIRERADQVRDRLKALPIDSFFPDASVKKSAAIEENALSPEQVGAFEGKLREYVHSIQGISSASGKKFIDEDEFIEWWDQVGKAKYLNAATIGKFGALTMEAFVTQTWLAHMADEARAKGDPSSFYNFLEDTIGNRAVLTGLTYSWYLVYGVSIWVAGTFVSTLVVGPVADIVRVFVEPLVKPIKERISRFATRTMMKPSVALTNLLNRQKEAVVDAEKAVIAEEQIQANLNALKLKFATVEMDFAGMDSKTLMATMKDLQKVYVQMNILWDSHMTGALSHGRGVLSDALIFRPEAFAMATTAADTNFQVHKQGYTAGKNALLANHGSDPEFQSRFKELLQVNKDLVDLQVEASEKVFEHPEDVARVAANKKRLVVLSAELEAHGVDRDLLRNILENHMGMFRARKLIATTVAVQIFHDLQFGVFNRDLPSEVIPAFKLLQANFGYDFFMDEFRKEIHALLGKISLAVSSDLAEIQKRAATYSEAAKISGEISSNAHAPAADSCAAQFSRLKSLPKH